MVRTGVKFVLVKLQQVTHFTSVQYYSDLNVVVLSVSAAGGLALQLSEKRIGLFLLQCRESASNLFEDIC